MTKSDSLKGRGPLKITGLIDGYGDILSVGAIEFLDELSVKFGHRIDELLADRRNRQEEYDRGTLPDFLDETRKIRNSEWRVAEIPEPLTDRRVEITGPVDRKMIINALNSGAKVYMADFEDSSSPTWGAMMDGQVNLKDAVDGIIEFENGKLSISIDEKNSIESLSLEDTFPAASLNQT